MHLLLAELGANPNLQSRNGCAPLHYAVANGFLHTARLLARNGANPNIKNRFGNSPLRWACDRGFVEMAKMLIIEGGACADLPDNVCFTSLQRAIIGGSADVAQLLVIEFRADCAACNHARQTAADIAREYMPKLVPLLLQTSEQQKHGCCNPVLIWKCLSEEDSAIL